MALAAAAIAAVLAYVTAGSGSAPLDPLAACARAPGADTGQGAGRPAPDPDREGVDAGECALRSHPETFADLAASSNAVAERVAADSPAEAAAAAGQRTRLAHRAAGHTRGRWHPVGKGPLHADDPTYQSTYGDGFGTLSGRISDYAYDRKHGRVYAAVASGGVWESTNGGRKWHSIGNGLPTQTVGSVAYSPARGGTLIAVTGDNAFGGNTYGGLGVFRSTNRGRTWHRSPGVPRGAQGFKAAVDPTNSKVVYAATGAGLFRSRNDGRSFRNVDLPTGKRCRGNSFRRRNCFFANIVTDVVVQAPDKFNHKGGTVLAAVGWREGARKNFNGVPEAPANGLYRSDGGRPGTFTRLNVDANGFAPQNRVGRVELGAATGPQQNHGYVYAVVQDAVLFDKGTVEGLDVPDESAFGLVSTATPTYLNGIYVSSDFGKTWAEMADRNQMLLPTSGSVLAQLTPLGFGPGIQSWYDEWIRPDPTKQQGGVPTRLVFGLEELFENQLPLPQNGHSTFKAIGPYNANGGACLLVLASPACSQAQQADPSNTTTHPDQHGGIFVPDGHGGVTLLAGGDGGNYTQHVSQSGDFTRQGFGKGDQLGLHTLLPYGVAEARDGVVYAGLQDNGEIRINRKGRQVEVFGGDGVFTQVNPRNSRVAYEEFPDAGTNVTTDGGKTWSDIDPLVDNPSFYAPLVMDPKNRKHLLTGGKQIVETTKGPKTTSPGTNPVDSSTDWKTVFNLGRSKHHVENQVSAIGVRGKHVYAGYCGDCDPVLDHKRFFSGLATNVGGKRKPKPGTKRGWHKVRAKGLPQRFISSVTIAPHHPRTVYVTLGASDLRPYAPPNAIGRSGEATRGGHVYKSTDGGRRFHDISGNLEKVPSLWSVVRGHRLIVATTVGVFISRGKHGRRYSLLGRGLPPAPVFSMQRVPGHPRKLVIASLGRGVYRYTFPKRR
jgi:photosystem II stability/assembly factor-like uncharacterized protein